jgi:DNA-directed RNA polymerase subunit RPC12/RpoP
MSPLLLSETFNMKCERCKDQFTIQEGNRLIPCPYCMTPERLMKSIKGAIADSRKEKRHDLVAGLEAVLQFLPDSPVMAILEAEHHILNTNLILMIRDTFNVLPFGDQSYQNPR